MATFSYVALSVSGAPTILSPKVAIYLLLSKKSHQGLLAAHENGRTLDIRLENPRVYVTLPANRHRFPVSLPRSPPFHDISLRLPFRLETVRTYRALPPPVRSPPRFENPSP